MDDVQPCQLVALLRSSMREAINCAARQRWNSATQPITQRASPILGQIWFLEQGPGTDVKTVIKICLLFFSAAQKLCLSAKRLHAIHLISHSNICGCYDTDWRHSVTAPFLEIGKYPAGRMQYCYCSTPVLRLQFYLLLVLRPLHFELFVFTLLML